MSDPVAEARWRLRLWLNEVSDEDMAAFDAQVEWLIAAVRRAALLEAVECVYDVPDGVPFHRSTVAAAIRRLAEEGK